MEHKRITPKRSAMVAASRAMKLQPLKDALEPASFHCSASLGMPSQALWQAVHQRYLRKQLAASAIRASAVARRKIREVLSDMNEIVSALNLLCLGGAALWWLRRRIGKSQNPHPVAQFATRMGHLQYVFRRRDSRTTSSTFGR